MQSNQVNFTSGIRVKTHISDFYDVRAGFDYVSEPWTSKEIIRAPLVYTDDIKTCTTSGIIVQQSEQPLDIVMSHIDPENEANLDFGRIADAIYEKLAGHKPLHGFLIGSKNKFAFSRKMFDLFEDFFTNKLCIPYTKFKGIPAGLGDFVHFSYNGISDEATIFSSVAYRYKGLYKNKHELVRNVFDEVEIAHMDTIVEDGPDLFMASV